MGRLVDVQFVTKALGLVAEKADPVLLTELWIPAAEETFEQATGRVFSAASGDPTTTKTFRAFGQKSIRVPDLRDVDSVELDGSELVAGDNYDLEPEAVYGEPATHISLASHRLSSWLAEGEFLEVTGKWGFNPTPDRVKYAVVSLAARMYREKDAAYSDSVMTAEGIVFNYFRQFPLGVQAAVNHYRVRNFAIVGLA